MPPQALTVIVTIVLVIIIFRMNKKVEREIYRNRMLQAFIAGTIRTVSDYQWKLHLEDEPERASKFPISYRAMLDNIGHEFVQGMPFKDYEKWLKMSRELFSYEPKRYCNDDGFNLMYLDFFDRLVRQWESDDKKQMWLQTSP